MDEKKLPKITKSEIMYRGFLTVKRDSLLNPLTGKKGYHEYVELPNLDGISVLPITKKNNVILLKEYRHTIRRVLYGLVGGILKDGEDKESAARRELKEEAGYSAEKLEELISVHPLSGTTPSRVTLFIAKGLKK